MSRGFGGQLACVNNQPDMLSRQMMFMQNMQNMLSQQTQSQQMQQIQQVLYANQMHANNRCRSSALRLSSDSGRPPRSATTPSRTKPHRTSYIKLRLWGCNIRFRSPPTPRRIPLRIPTLLGHSRTSRQTTLASKDHPGRRHQKFYADRGHARR